MNLHWHPPVFSCFRLSRILFASCLLVMPLLFGSPAPARALDQVTLQLKWFHQFQFAGFYAAEEQGYYREAGLDVNFLEGQPDKGPIDKVLQGAAQYGVDDCRLLLARNDGKPVVALGVIFQHSPAILIARQDSAAQNIHDLARKRIMLDETTEDISAYLVSEGLTKDRYTLIRHSFNLQDLLDGKVDAISAYLTNEPFFLDQLGFNYLAFTPRSAGIDFYGDTLFTTEQELKNHPERVKAFREASFRGWKYALAHADEMVDLILAKYSQHKSREHLLAEARQMTLLIQPDLVELGYMNPGRCRHIADTYADLGILPRNFPLTGFLYSPEPKSDHTHIVVLAFFLAGCLMTAMGIVWALRKMVRVRTKDLDQANRRLTLHGYQMASIINGTTDAVYIKDLQGRYVVVNDEVERLFGRPREEIIGLDDHHFLPAKEAEALIASDRAIMGGNQVVTREEPITTLDQLRVYLATKGPVHDEDGNVMGLFGISRNITDLKRQEEALKKSNDQFLSLVANTPGHIAYVNAHTLRYEFVNEQFEKSFGIPVEKIIGSEVRDIIGEKNFAHALPYINEVKTGKSVSYENTFNLVTGQRWIRVNYSPIFADDVQVSSIVVLSYDITERKLAEQALQESEQKLKNLLAHIPTALALTDEQGRITFRNKRFVELFGYSEAEVANGEEWWLHAYPDEQIRQRAIANWKAAVQRAIDTDRNIDTKEYPVTCKDGVTRLIEITGILLGKDILTTFVDVTERKRLEEERQTIEKLKSLGTLAGGLAHDFNNILAGLYGNISLAKSKLAKDAPDHPGFRFIEAAEKSMNSAVLLTNQLLTFAKGGAPVKENLSLQSLIEEVVQFNLSGSNVKAVITPADSLWLAKADQGQVQQVFANLTINAIQAMPSGGHLRIALKNVDTSKNPLSGLGKGRFIRVTVADQGTGIAPEHLDRIFDPYFTTKQTGSGLGLATIYSIIKRHGGHISVASQLGKGTTFTLYLPASETRELSPKVSPVEAPQNVVPAKVLVMDDEEVIRSTISDMLEDLGYAVATAAEGQQSLDLYRQAFDSGRPFDLAILDLTIPGGVGGKETARRILQIDPEARLVVSSGYADDPIMANCSEFGFCGVVAKPYSLQKLSSVLTQVLGK